MNFEEHVYALIKELRGFQYEISYSDHIWDFIFPDKKEKYHHLVITKYRDTYYLSCIDGEFCSLEIILEKEVKSGDTFTRSCRDDGRNDPAKVWGELITYARKWLVIVEKDWVKANRKIYLSYPLNRRIGYVSNAVVSELISDIYHINKELGKTKVKKFIRLVEEGYFRDDKKTIRESMTLNDFFEYCRIAYTAAQ